MPQEDIPLESSPDVNLPASPYITNHFLNTKQYSEMYWITLKSEVIQSTKKKYTLPLNELTHNPQLLQATPSYTTRDHLWNISEFFHLRAICWVHRADRRPERCHRDWQKDMWEAVRATNDSRQQMPNYHIYIIMVMCLDPNEVVRAQLLLSGPGVAQQRSRLNIYVTFRDISIVCCLSQSNAMQRRPVSRAWLPSAPGFDGYMIFITKYHLQRMFADN